MTDNSMTERKWTKGQTKIYKTVHQKNTYSLKTCNLAHLSGISGYFYRYCSHLTSLNNVRIFLQELMLTSDKKYYSGYGYDKKYSSGYGYDRKEYSGNDKKD
jgi:hypothetical protein